MKAKSIQKSTCTRYHQHVDEYECWDIGVQLPDCDCDIKLRFPNGQQSSGGKGRVAGGFHIFKLPVKAEHADRKKGFEIAIVRCKDHRWDDTKKVNAYLTNLNGGTDSFESHSCVAFETDLDVLWEYARQLYNSW